MRDPRDQRMQRPNMAEDKGCRILAEKPLRMAGFTGFDDQTLVAEKPCRRMVFGNLPRQPFEGRRVKRATVFFGRGQRRIERLRIVKRGAITRQRRRLKRPMAGAGTELIMRDNDMDAGRAHRMRAGPEDYMQTRRKGPPVF